MLVTLYEPYPTLIILKTSVISLWKSAGFILRNEHVAYLQKETIA